MSHSTMAGATFYHASKDVRSVILSEAHLLHAAVLGGKPLAMLKRQPSPI